MVGQMRREVEIQYHLRFVQIANADRLQVKKALKTPKGYITKFKMPK
jgi:hypothetical protein